MSAIRPNMNFDNERREHTPYKEITAASLQQRYIQLMKAPDNSGRHRAPAIKDVGAYTKWFNKQQEQ